MRVYLFWCIPFRTEYDDQDLPTIPFLRRLFLGLNPVSILIYLLLRLPDCSALMTTIVAFWFCILSFWTMGFGSGIAFRMVLDGIRHYSVSGTCG